MRASVSFRILVLTICLAGTDCLAEDYPLWIPEQAVQQSAFVVSPPNGILLFGGQFTTDNISRSLIPFAASHESNYILGVAYERDFLQKWDFALGG